MISKTSLYYNKSFDKMNTLIAHSVHIVRRVLIEVVSLLSWSMTYSFNFLGLIQME